MRKPYITTFMPSYGAKARDPVQAGVRRRAREHAQTDQISRETDYKCYVRETMSRTEPAHHRVPLRACILYLLSLTIFSLPLAMRR